MDRELTPAEFNEHTNKIINVATGGGVLPNDVIGATAKALGVLIAFTARREHTDFQKLINTSQRAVANYAYEAQKFMQQREGGVEVSKSKKWSLSKVAIGALLITTGVFLFNVVQDGGADLAI